MKKCSFCDTELLFSKEDDPAKCRLCGGDVFIDETEEELRLRRKQEEKKELCCPNPACPPQLRPRAERHCVRCGESLKEATVELWLEKCVKPRLEEVRSDSAPAIEAAWLMGLDRENTVEHLKKYVKHHSQRPDEAPEVKALESTPLALSATARGEEPYRLPDMPSLGSANPEIGHTESKTHVLIALTSLLLVVLAGYYFWPKGAGQNIKATLSPSPPTPTPTPTPLSPQPEMPPGMTYIPGGEFTMGRDVEDRGDEYESPSHPVKVRPFLIDTYEVTRQEYQKCVEVKQCPIPEGWVNGIYPAGTSRWPVTGVNWYAATAYAKWSGKRLPTEEEWEYAARGAEGRLYPWGNVWQQGLANANGVRDEPANVGEYKGASPFNIFDLVGNAWEWTASDFKAYAGSVAKQGLAASDEKVIRGGYWGSRAARATTTFRTGWRARGEEDYSNTGFRCAMDAPKN
jgi:formylglycine-generating enzyme required for sulfatase activity